MDRGAGGGEGVDVVAHEDGASDAGGAAPPAREAVLVVEVGVVDHAVDAEGAVLGVDVDQLQGGGELVARVGVDAAVDLYLVVRVSIGGERYSEQLLGRPVGERLVLVGGLGVGPRPAAAPLVAVLVLVARRERQGVSEDRVGRVADVEERDLGHGPVEPESVRAWPDANGQERVGVDRVDVGGDAGDLELAEDLGVGWVREVDDPQRVHVAEGHEVGAVAHEAGAPDALSGGDVADVANLHKLRGLVLAALGNHALGGCEREHVVRRPGPLLGLEPPAAPGVLGGSHADDAVELRERELVLHRTVDPARCDVGGLRRVTDVEDVNVGRVVPAGIAPEPPPVVGGLGQNHDVLRGVDVGPRRGDVVDFQVDVVAEHLNRHNRGEAAAGAVGAGGEFAAVARAGRVLEQALRADLVDVWGEVIQS